MAKKSKNQRVGSEGQVDLLRAQAAVLHYEVDLPKQEVARVLGVSASMVTKWIKEAKQFGLVDYVFDMPIHYELSAKLLMEFSSSIQAKKSIVAPNSELSEGDGPFRTLALAARQHLEQIVSDGDRITLDGGNALSAVVESLRPQRFRGLQFYSVAGGLPHSPGKNPDTLVAKICGKAGRRSEAKCNFFPPFQGYLDKPSGALMKEGEWLVEQASQADVFLLGVGVPHKSSTLWDIEESTSGNPEDLASSGIVGVFGYTGINAQGEVADWTLGRSLFKVPPQALKEAAASANRHVVLIANGHPKVDAIRALLKGGWFNTLITDVETARAILKDD